MADGPAKKLARLGGGLAMMQGPIGHQVLGQLLISGSRSIEVAGASVVLALASRQPNVAAQVVARSVVPAVLVEVLGRQERRRLQQEVERLSERKRDLNDENKRLVRENEELQEKAANAGTKRTSKRGNNGQRN